jgi:polar amino acid transport system substrate-binding protein
MLFSSRYIHLFEPMMLRLFAILSLSLVLPTAMAATPLRVCAESDWAPYSFNQNGRSAGAAVELIQAIFKQQQIELQIDSGSYQRCLKLTASGQYDAVLNVGKTPERLAQFAWPQLPSMKIKLQLLANQQWPKQAPNFEVFGHKRVGITTGYEYPDAMLTQPGIIKIESLSELTNLRRLAAGNLDLMVLSEHTFSNLSSQLSNKEKAAIHNWGTLTELPIYVAFNPQASQLAHWLKAYDTGLSYLRKKGEDKTIFARWHITP